jgi:acyl-CoA synthetase (AMP-forming)/AMP-acid ligase II
MNMPPNSGASLRDALASRAGRRRLQLFAQTGCVCADDVLSHTSLGSRLDELEGRSILLATRKQLTAALALIELDGTASRLVLGIPDLPRAHLRDVATASGADVVLSDDDDLVQGMAVSHRVASVRRLTPLTRTPAVRHRTEWVLLTSGTSGAPKMIVHTFASLAASAANPIGLGVDPIWGTFYDIWRFGGLQIFFRAALTGGGFVLREPSESLAAYLVRLGEQGVTHVSGTPSHWRRVLMSPEAHAIAPRYIRLSGEIADQSILTALRSYYPNATVVHAFASTEAGLAFEVDDGVEGFPAGFFEPVDPVQLKVKDGSLCIKSPRTAARYLGDVQPPLRDDDGFVDTTDMVERRGERFYFLGRRTGVINVGGLKVYPEEVEAAINRHPAVRLSVVRCCRNSVVGSLVTADVVLKEELPVAPLECKREILRMCQQTLARHKVPSTIRFVQSLDLAPAGKVVRHA